MSLIRDSATTVRLVRPCHRRGAHAIGGMAAFVPNRREPEVTARALAKVREDKERESGDGFDGTWVAHPDLVPVAGEVFDRVLGEKPHQKDRLREDVAVGAAELLDVAATPGAVTREGVRNNVNVALHYLDAWLRGTGAAAIHDLMEDTATAEIARAQLWQWRRHAARLEDGAAVDAALYRDIRDDELARVRDVSGPDSRVDDAAALLDRLVLDEAFIEFLTLPGGELLERDRP
jgi:malate synthase